VAEKDKETTEESTRLSKAEKDAQQENLDDDQKEALKAYNERQKQLKEIGAI
jgi:hypothetical protein